MLLELTFNNETPLVADFDHVTHIAPAENPMGTTIICFVDGSKAHVKEHFATITKQWMTSKEKKTPASRSV